jgi:DNA recombination protein RmuC
MTIPEILLLILLAVVLAAQFYSLYEARRRAAAARAAREPGDGLLLLQQQLEQLRKSMDARMGESNKAIQESVNRQLSESTKIVREVTEGLTKLGETNRQVVGFAEQLKQLQDVLKNPKQRGILGEYYLETVLQNVLPPGSYQMQYGFENGEIVDAAVFVKDKIVPVDSKFSLENYNRMLAAEDNAERERHQKAFVNDLKLRIQETAKYIRPTERTTDFAFMFIPSEGVYYDLLANPATLAAEENLIQRAAGTYKVIIVSPTSFLAYLQTVLQGLKALEIEEKAKDIIKNVEKLGTHLQKYETYYEKVGNTLATTVNHYNAGYKELAKVDKDITRITGETIGIEPAALEQPARTEG